MSPEPEASHSKLTVLLIEDSPVQARLIRQELVGVAGTPFDVECAGQLQSGLERLAQGGIDVVLVDLCLPDSQGLDTFLKLQLHAPSVPIVVLSILTDEAMALEAVRKGAQDYLMKGEADGRILTRILRYAVERKRFEHYIQQSTQELARLKDDFVANVSHELRTPLGIIRESVSLVMSGSLGEINEEQRTFLTMSSEQLDRLVALINNLLDLSKIEAGKLALARRSIDLAEVAEETCRAFQVTAKGRQIVRQFGIAPPVFADRDRLTQILTNLLSNAIKFTPETGTVTVGMAVKGNYVACSVKDTGSGIAPEDLGKLFQKFQQVGAASERPRGTGLGLVICKELVERLQGTISVTSEVGRGATFTFTVPIYNQEQVLRALFDETATAAKVEQGTFALFLIDLRELPARLAHVRDKALEQAVLNVEATVRATLRSDRVIMLDEGLLAILAVAGPRGVARMQRRLQEVCAQWAEQARGVQNPVRMTCTAASYPEDGRSPEELMKQAKARLSAPGARAHERRIEGRSTA